MSNGASVIYDSTGLVATIDLPPVDTAHPSLLVEQEVAQCLIKVCWKQPLGNPVLLPDGICGQGYFFVLTDPGIATATQLRVSGGEGRVRFTRCDSAWPPLSLGFPSTQNMTIPRDEGGNVLITSNVPHLTTES